jgi:triosephosphate isomerase
LKGGERLFTFPAADGIYDSLMFVERFLLNKIEKPLIILNFKCYAESIGPNALRLAKIAEKVSEDIGLTIIIAPTLVDLPKVTSEVSIPVFAQHMDPIELGAHTGYIPGEALKEAGAVGTLVNHSERRLLLADVESCISRAMDLGLYTCVCSNNAPVSAATAALNPTMVAVEPPELIGSGKSVSKTKPEVVTSTVKLIRGINNKVIILCGAGITTQEDARAAIRLGADGVLLASAFTKATDPAKVLSELAIGTSTR